MGHDGGAEWEIETYRDEDGEMDAWCIAEVWSAECRAEGKNGD